MVGRTDRRSLSSASVGLALSLAACGRIGVELTPLDKGPLRFSPRDAGRESGVPIDLDGSVPVELESGVSVDLDSSTQGVPESGASVDLDGSSAEGTPVCNAGVCGAVCDLTGTFALKISQQTSWPNNANLRAGSGTHVFWLKMSGTHTGNQVRASWTECGRSIPEFRASAINETFRFDLPRSIFDLGYLPSSAATVSLGSAAPGAKLALPSTAFLIGTTMSDPIGGAWPSATGLTSVDMDGDGKSGVTMNYLTTGSYVAPHVGATLFDARAERPYAATRLVFSLDGALTSCTSSSGTATVSHIDTGIFGCKIAGNARDCSAGEASFLDQNCLRYAVGSATYALLRVAAGASCAAVRAALP